MPDEPVVIPSVISAFVALAAPKLRVLPVTRPFALFLQISYTLETPVIGKLSSLLVCSPQISSRWVTMDISRNYTTWKV